MVNRKLPYLDAIGTKQGDIKTKLFSPFPSVFPFLLVLQDKVQFGFYRATIRKRLTNALGLTLTVLVHVRR